MAVGLLDEKQSACAPRMAPTPKISPAAYGAKRQAQQGASSSSSSSSSRVQVITQECRSLPGMKRPQNKFMQSVAKRFRPAPIGQRPPGSQRPPEPPKPPSTRLKPKEPAYPPPKTAYSSASTAKAAKPANPKGTVAKAMPKVKCLPLDTVRLTQAKSWVGRVLQAALTDDTKQGSLLSEAHQLQMTTSILHASGAGIALAQKWLWEALDDTRQQRRMQLCKKWRVSMAEEKEKFKNKNGYVRYPKGLERSLLLGESWRQQLLEIKSWLDALADEKSLETDASRLAVRLLCTGFRDIDALEGLPDGSLQRITSVPRELALLLRARQLVTDAAFKRRARMRQEELGVKPLGASGPRSAIELAASLTPDALAALEKSNQELEAQFGISLGWENQGDLQVRSGPRETTHRLAAARQAGKGAEVTAFLEQHEQVLKLETQRRSLPQVASGLRAWHFFAVTVLDYQEEATIPPGSSEDVIKFVQVFNNAGTAANYISHLRWACKAYKKGTDWSTAELGMVLKGLHKQDLRTRLSQLPQKLKLDEQTMLRLICMARTMNDIEFAVLACWSYHFLLRVQSEAIEIEVGQPSDAQRQLPESRHSAIWVDEDKIYLKLRRRKHRPAGSLLVRHCECPKEGENWCCPVHCLSFRYSNAGERVFPAMTASLMKRKLKRYLLFLEVPHSAQVGLKVFRASRATNLALAGRPVAHILQAGEWRSAAVLNYIDEEALLQGAMDKAAILAKAIQQSDSESED